MKHFIILCTITLLTCLGSFSSCKQENTTMEETAAETNTLTDTLPAPPPDTLSARPVNPNLVENMPWTFLTHKLFHNRATVVRGNASENPKEGHWIDFHEDGTFEYGIWDKKTQQGTWRYDDSTKLLQIMPDQADPSEWRVMHKVDNIVLVGTATYGNNTNQEQWVRRDKRPDKNARPAEEE